MPIDFKDGVVKLTPPRVRTSTRPGSPRLIGGQEVLRGEGGFFLERGLLGGEMNVFTDPKSTDVGDRLLDTELIGRGFVPQWSLIYPDHAHGGLTVLVPKWDMR